MSRDDRPYHVRHPEDVSTAATTGDINRLIRELDRGWVGRGVQLALGAWLFSLSVGLVLFMAGKLLGML